MSMQFIPAPSQLPPTKPCGLARCFGDHIRITRTSIGRSIEKAARSAGLTAQEWEEIEAGTLPDSLEQVLLMGCALGATQQWQDYIARLYAAARRGQLLEHGIVLRPGQGYL